MMGCFRNKRRIGLRTFANVGIVQVESGMMELDAAFDPDPARTGGQTVTLNAGSLVGMDSGRVLTLPELTVLPGHKPAE